MERRYGHPLFVLAASANAASTEWEQRTTAVRAMTHQECQIFWSGTLAERAKQPAFTEPEIWQISIDYLAEQLSDWAAELAALRDVEQARGTAGNSLYLIIGYAQD